MSKENSEELNRLTQSLRGVLEEEQFWGLELKRKKKAVMATDLLDASPSGQLKPANTLTREARIRELENVAEQVRACKKCRLYETRNNTVPGEGNPQARVLFIGEGPGATEDETGRPFVGRAGKLLTDIIEKGMKIKREEVFIANIVKCRPPENREPAPDEILACMPYLRRQIEILGPEFIVPLGRPATSTLLETNGSMSSMRGKVHVKNGQKYLPTFHPAYLLRNPPEKKKTWEDIQLLMKELGLPIS